MVTAAETGKIRFQGLNISNYCFLLIYQCSTSGKKNCRSNMINRFLSNFYFVLMVFRSHCKQHALLEIAQSISSVQKALFLEKLDKYHCDPAPVIWIIYQIFLWTLLWSWNALYTLSRKTYKPCPSKKFLWHFMTLNKM